MTWTSAAGYVLSSAAFCEKHLKVFSANSDFETDI